MRIKIILICLVFLTGCANQNIEFGASLTESEKIDTELTKIAELQEIERTKDDKYKRVEEVLVDGITYKVDEFVSPNGVGYHVTMTKIEDSKLYKKIESRGDLLEDRTYDWRLIKDNTSSSTPK